MKNLSLKADLNYRLKFASWTYDGYQVDLLINDEAGGNDNNNNII